MAVEEPTDRSTEQSTGQSTGQPAEQTVEVPVEEPAAPAPAAAAEPAPVVRRRRGLRDLEPVLLVQAAHPKQAVVTALGIAACAALAGRELREVGVVLLTVLVGQTILGWHNDLVDRRRDARHDLPGKPVAQDRLEPGSVWFAIACGVLLLVPLAVSTGITAGSCYLLAVAIGLLGNVVLRKGVLSWVPWAASFALYPAYLAYGGWGGQHEGNPPEVAMVALFALLGIGVHVLRALWGLVPDNKDGWTYLPLRLGLRLGAARLLTLTSVYLGAVLVGLAFAGTSVGLSG
ncbi:UbiA family prenyltransferase [Nocardioides sp. SOB72]|uniref:UbiA family prenyltransferase n=1 Tax=Nocardioides abyssi TaxID=3058370 RepID=A0ABT8EWF9_9ACTN|nr:UbiA family prenyltransferase [Nocardioides abyssi]